MLIQIPCGRGAVTAEIPESRLAGVFRAGTPEAAADPGAAVDAALDHPIGSVRLEELARGKKNAVIIASDHTRPVPSRILMPRLLERLRRGNPEIDVTILIATGFHRLTTRDELIAKFGEEIVRNERIAVHDSGDPAQLVEIGVLPSGGKLIVNRLAAETDLLLSEGFIEPHFFAGFSGGRKSVLPGVAARTTVLANHCAEFIASPNARTGVLADNPIHRDMLYAAKTAGLRFILNVVIDGGKRIVRAFAGAPEEAHAAGCEFLRGVCRIEVPESEIVVTGNGGYPLDQNVYQSVKGMTAAEAVCRPGGVIVMVAGCADGHGGESFFRHLAEAESPGALLAEIARVPRDRTAPDQWEYQILARILSRFRVIVVSPEGDAEMLRAMKLIPAPDLPTALQQADEMTGGAAQIAVIPDGVSVICKKIKL